MLVGANQGASAFQLRLKREVGVIPTRSRHCIWEQACKMSLYESMGRRKICYDHEPGDLPISATPTNLRG